MWMLFGSWVQMIAPSHVYREQVLNVKSLSHVFTKHCCKKRCVSAWFSNRKILFSRASLNTKGIGKASRML